MSRVVLYEVDSPGIKISIEVYFKGKDLFFDGYDIGPLVEKHWGESDYEYTYTVEPPGVLKFYEVMGIKVGNESALLQEIKKRFSGGSAYSLFGKFMSENNIPHDGFNF